MTRRWIDLDVRVLPSPLEVAAAAAELVVDEAVASVAARGRFTMALSGGSTPALLYAVLAAAPYTPRMPWPQTHLFWSDERWVPLDDPDSNAGMAKRELVDKVPAPHDQVHPIQTTDLTPAESARRYEEEVRALGAGGAPPRFDVILLGLGDDGHTASLFPGSAALDEQDRLVVANYVPQLGSWRVTFTLPLLNAARRVLFLVTGAGKASALRAVLEPEDEALVPPAALVHPDDGSVTWLVDREAVSRLAGAQG